MEGVIKNIKTIFFFNAILEKCPKNKVGKIEKKNSMVRVSFMDMNGYECQTNTKHQMGKKNCR